MQNFKSALLYVAALVLLSSSPAFGESLESRFFAEYESAHAALKARFSSFKVKCDLEFAGGDGVAYAIFKKGELFRSEFEVDSRAQVLCRAEDRWFACTRELDRTNWSLAITTEIESDMPLSFLESRKTVTPHFTVFGVELSSLIESPDFNLVSSKEVLVAGSLCLRLEFDSFPVLDVGGDKRTTVTVDPERQWRIVSANLARKDGRPLVIKVSYSETDQLPRELDLTVGGEPYRKLIFEDWSFGKLPGAPFTLEHYGLGLKRRGTSYYTYALILAVVLGGVFVVWKIRSQG